MRCKVAKNKLIKMKVNFTDLTTKLFRYLSLFVAITCAFLYLIVVVYRIQYPVGIEWVENAVALSVKRILSGDKLYDSPSLEFVPLIYPPLYFYLSAVISKITGVGFFPLRLLSVISTLGSFATIFFLVKRETRDEFIAILASCLFLATFQISGSWFDIGRVDSLFVFLLLLSVYTIRFYSSWQAYVISGLFISLSFLTKQTAITISLPLMVWLLIRNKRFAVLFIVTVFLILLSSTLIFDRIHDGWYSYYVFDLPKHFEIYKLQFIIFWTGYVTRPLGLACILSIPYFFTNFSVFNKSSLFYLSLVIGTLGSSCMAKSLAGSNDNALIPSYAIISVLFGLGIHNAFEFIKGLTKNRKQLIIYVYFICILQFANLIYNPKFHIPKPTDFLAAMATIQEIKKVQGNVFIPIHSYLSSLAGKSSFADWLPVYDILRSGDSQTKAKLINEIALAIREKKFNAIIFNPNYNYDLLRSEINIELSEYIKKYYMESGTTFDAPFSGVTIKGPQIREKLFMYIPRTE